jgi:hypothetical protein
MEPVYGTTNKNFISNECVNEPRPTQLQVDEDFQNFTPLEAKKPQK